jgi:DNA-binding phage protein
VNPKAAERLGIAPYDSADYLRDEEDVIGYLRAVMAVNSADPACVAHALGVAERVRGGRQQEAAQ